MELIALTVPDVIIDGILFIEHKLHVAAILMIDQHLLFLDIEDVLRAISHQGGLGALHVFFDRKRIGFSGFAPLLLEERDILAVELLERLVLSLLADAFAVQPTRTTAPRVSTRPNILFLASPS